MLNLKNKFTKFMVGSLLSLQVMAMSPVVDASSYSLLNSTIGEKTTETEQIVVSNVIPMDIETQELNEEVMEEVRLQEALEARIKAEIEEELRLEEIDNYISSIICDPGDISKVSGLKEEDYYLLTKGTWWEGNEQTLIDLENNYGINAMFAMSVSTLESGFGRSDRAKTRNNYYGIEVPKVWDSLYSNTQYWGKLIKNHYVDEGRPSVWSISSKYCPPNANYWASFNSDKMNEFYNELINKMVNTLK